MSDEPNWRSMVWWRNLLLQGLAVSIILFLLIVLAAALNNQYGKFPPVHVTSLDPLDLGELCTGESIPIHNLITIDLPTVVTYDWSTMDEARHFNFLGTSYRYPGLPHPVPEVTFRQEMPWSVPDLPPGRYARVFSARGHDSDEKPAFTWNFYTIKDCSQPAEEELNERVQYPWNLVGDFAASARYWYPGWGSVA